MSIPRIIHHVHFGGTMPGDNAHCVLSARLRNLSWSHILWDETMLHLFGAEVRARLDELPNHAARSNLLRLVILKRFGGIYLDTDCDCHASLEKLVAYPAFAAMQDGERICNAVMGAEPNHSWVNWQLEHWNDFDQKDAASGVYLATAAPRDGLTLIPTEWVYPWMYDAPPEKRVPHPDSLITHHWRGSWR